jgi:ADP-heptose:LPS heptosyltransferase
VKPHRGKILVIRGGAIGDFILTLPALAALRQHFPEAIVEVLGYPHIVHLAVAGGLVDDVKAIEARGLASFFARGGTLDPALAEYFSTFNLIISYLYDPDLIFETNVRACTDSQFIAGPHRPPENSEIHAAVTFLKPLQRLAIFDADPVPRLPIALKRAPDTWLALHPGSGSESKNWPEARWLDLMERLMAQTNWQFLMIGGEAEGDRLEQLASAFSPERVQLARGLTLVEVAQMLTQCSFYIGHDSGISHLAAALGLPGLVLWGPSKRSVWGPLQTGFQVVEHPAGLGKLETAAVADVLMRSLLASTTA